MVKTNTFEELFTSSPFLVGSLISIADIYLIPIIVYFEKTPQFEAVIVSTPKLKAWWDEVKILASVQQICT
ncbi:MAG: glutathione S-transferase domain-containing protein [Cyanobacteria bacterium P01_G01_bin.67]